MWNNSLPLVLGQSFAYFWGFRARILRFVAIRCHPQDSAWLGPSVLVRSRRLSLCSRHREGRNLLKLGFWVQGFGFRVWGLRFRV